MTEREMPISLPALIDDILLGKQEAKGVLYLYLKQECYLKVTRFLLKRGAQEEDAEDLFQDAVIVLFSAIENRKFRLNTGIKSNGTQQFCSYLMGVAKNLWRKELRWRDRKPILQGEQLPYTLIEEITAEQLNGTFFEMEESCRQLLRYFFRDKLSPRAISSITNQKTDVVKQQLDSCINRFLKDVGHLLDEEESNQKSELLAHAMGELDDRCRNILTRFYYDKMRMRDIAEELGYASAGVVAEQKNRCMKRLYTAIANSLINRK